MGGCLVVSYPEQDVESSKNLDKRLQAPDPRLPDGRQPVTIIKYDSETEPDQGYQRHTVLLDMDQEPRREPPRKNATGKAQRPFSFSAGQEDDALPRVLPPINPNEIMPMEGTDPTKSRIRTQEIQIESALAYQEWLAQQSYRLGTQNGQAVFGRAQRGIGGVRAASPPTGYSFQSGFENVQQSGFENVQQGPLIQLPGKQAKELRDNLGRHPAAVFSRGGIFFDPRVANANPGLEGSQAFPFSPPPTSFYRHPNPTIRLASLASPLPGRDFDALIGPETTAGGFVITPLSADTKNRSVHSEGQAATPQPRGQEILVKK